MAKVLQSLVLQRRLLRKPNVLPGKGLWKSSGFDQSGAVVLGDRQVGERRRQLIGASGGRRAKARLGSGGYPLGGSPSRIPAPRSQNPAY
jgi:hypothetical protein